MAKSEGIGHFFDDDENEGGETAAQKMEKATSGCANPLYGVRGVVGGETYTYGGAGANMTAVGAVDGYIPVPNSYKWSSNDISDNDAGRTEDTVMDKQRIGNARKVELKWKNLTTAEASALLNAFKSEYLEVVYLDPMEGGFCESEFYCGDPSATCYNTTLGLWSEISFNLIERSGAKDYIDAGG